MESFAVKRLRERIAELLSEIGTYGVDKDGDYFIRYRGFIIFFEPYPFGETGSLLRIIVPLIMKVPRSRELLEYLMEESSKTIFGKFVIFPDGLVGYEQTILGDTLDESFFETSLTSVAMAALEYGHILEERFGGVLCRRQE